MLVAPGRCVARAEPGVKIDAKGLVQNDGRAGHAGGRTGQGRLRNRKQTRTRAAPPPRNKEAAPPSRCLLTPTGDHDGKRGQQSGTPDPLPSCWLPPTAPPAPRPAIMAAPPSSRSTQRPSRPAGRPAGAPPPAADAAGAAASPPPPGSQWRRRAGRRREQPVGGRHRDDVLVRPKRAAGRLEDVPLNPAHVSSARRVPHLVLVGGGVVATQ